MARGVNKVILIGNLGDDPLIRYMPSGTAVANVSLATSDQWKNKQSGEPEECTEWHRVAFFARLAEVVGEYLHKGSKIYVEGKLQRNKYEKDGQTHYATKIIACEMQMLDSRGESSARAPARAAQARRPAASDAPRQSDGDDFYDDIPF